MTPIPVAQRKVEILELLCTGHIKTVFLYGEAGVGKTWTATEVSKLARQKGLFQTVLWVYLSRNYDRRTLTTSIAQQLSLLPTPGEFEVDEAEEMSDMLPMRIQSTLSKTSLLLVLDDEGSSMSEEDIMPLLNSLLTLNVLNHKLLVTTRSPGRAQYTDISRSYYLVDRLLRVEAVLLLKKITCHDRKLIGIDTLAEDFIQRTQFIPTSISLMAKAFKYFSDKGGARSFQLSLEESSESKAYNVIDLLSSGYNIVPNSILIDCQRDHKDKPFLADSRGIYYNQLIAYWIMEGYLGHVTCLDEAFRKGYKIFLELLDFQLLKRVEGSYVSVSPLKEELNDFLWRRATDDYRLGPLGYFAYAHLGLDRVFANYDCWNGVLRISHEGGVAGATYRGKQGQNVSALLLDGDAYSKTNLGKFVNPLNELQVLGIFNPTVHLLSPFSFITNELHIFVLRNCRYLENIDQLIAKNFFNLTVLEISGLRPLEIPEDFFVGMPKLQSLNLSALPVTLLPSSLYTLGELKWLILRDCTSLESLSSLRDCKRLVVLDCSGSTSLSACHDRSFVNADLEVIDLSNTKISILPLISTLKKLTHLLLSKCSKLKRLRSIKDIASLEVIDLSGSRNFNEFYDKSLEKLVNLKVLDLSGTAIYTLPSDIGKPIHICLENCTQLEGENTLELECLSKMKDLERFVISYAGIYSLPTISHLTNLRQLSVTCCLDLEAIPDLSSLEKLENLDFSGCNNIKHIPYKTFEKKSRLQNLNLSGTRIDSVPSLENLRNLRHLLLKDCKELKTLPSVEPGSLEKLEELNVSGGKALRNIDDNFFQGTINLLILNLSDTPLHKLPSYSKLENLHELRLRNCKGLKAVPNLETLTSLVILDLSGSSVSDLPSLSNLSNLRELRLNNCSSLSHFQEMRIVDVLGRPIQGLPYRISTLTSLDRLDLPSMSDFQEEETDDCEWGISSLLTSNENRPFVSVSGSQFIQPLGKNTSIWESKFHLCVYPTKDFGEKSVPHFQGDDSVFRNIYLTNRYIGESDDQRLVEISGFTGDKPAGIETVLRHANQFFFMDNKFQIRVPEIEKNRGLKIHPLASFLTACDPKQIKGCWIEKYNETSLIFRVEETDKILAILNSVDTLSFSNSESLKRIFATWKNIDSKKDPPSVDSDLPDISDSDSEKEDPEEVDSETEIPKDTNSEPETTGNADSIIEFAKYEVFQNLEKLYIECCPKLTFVLSLSHLPQKLKILQIKFCDKLSKVFDQTSLDTTLQYLETLHLWELPELESIGCQLPSLKTLKISNCSKLQKLEETIRSSENLQNLSISNLHNLKTIYIPKELKFLSVESCRELLNIYTSSQPPSDLEIRIRFCNKLETLFGEGTSMKIKSLHLHGLPNLKSICHALPNQMMRFEDDA